MSVEQDCAAYALSITYGFNPIPGGVYEPHYIADSLIRYYTLAHLRDHTNVLIKFDASQLPPPTEKSS